MKTIRTLLVALLLAGATADAQVQWFASAQLDANNVNATVRIGDLWFNSFEGEYFVPKDDPDPKTSIFAGGLWMGGIDPGGQLNGSISTYGGTNYSNYWAGPLNPATGLTDDESRTNWNRLFEIYSSELALHLQDYNADGIINNPTPTNILGWPGRGNPEFPDVHNFELPDQDLAPFFDRDNDGIYEPLAGDFPLMKGEKAIWWVFNDSEAGAFPVNAVGVEIQAMAFAYSSDDEDLNNTTFYDFKLINRALEQIDSTYGALWLDPDLGCFEDDYIGCSPQHNLAYVYNADDFDEDCGVAGYGSNIPVLGIRVLKGMDDETSTGPGFSNFMYYNNPSAPDNPHPATTDPGNGPEMYRLLTGSWIDGTPLTQGGTGYNPGSNQDPYPYAYDGSALSDSLDWTMCDLDTEMGDRRMVISSGPVGMEPGTVRYLSYAVIWSEIENYPCPDLTDFFNRSTAIADFYDNIGDGLFSDVQEQEALTAFAEVFPNPVADMVTVALENTNNGLERVEFYDVSGRLIHQAVANGDVQVEVSTNGWSSGVYFYRIINEAGRYQTGKLIKK